MLLMFYKELIILLCSLVSLLLLAVLISPLVRSFARSLACFFCDIKLFVRLIINNIHNAGKEREKKYVAHLQCNSKFEILI